MHHGPVLRVCTATLCPHSLGLVFHAMVCVASCDSRNKVPSSFGSAVSGASRRSVRKSDHGSYSDGDAEEDGRERRPRRQRRSPGAIGRDPPPTRSDALTLEFVPQTLNHRAQSYGALSRRWGAEHRLGELESIVEHDLCRPLSNPCGDCGGVASSWSCALARAGLL